MVVGLIYVSNDSTKAKMPAKDEISKLKHLKIRAL